MTGESGPSQDFGILGVRPLCHSRPIMSHTRDTMSTGIFGICEGRSIETNASGSCGQKVGFWESVLGSPEAGLHDEIAKAFVVSI